ncbi:MAG: YitT family protein [Christensenellaceae bacterium]|jgi:uncharacterized membrane-anchored protein YitT (DUF2179 family)|nr:YitT family protein [Christensenellaceae bacterium]
MNEKKKSFTRIVTFYTILVVLSFIRAFATYVFIVPNGFAPGGIGGIASILYNAILPFDEGLAKSWFNPAVTIFVFNAPLLVLAFKKVNKGFATNTTISVLLYSGFMALFSLIKSFPQFVAENQQSSFMILSSLAGGVLSGISLGFMLLYNTSAGGTDIIAKAVYSSKPAINVQWLIFMFDVVVVLLSSILGVLAIKPGESSSAAFVKILSPIFYSVIALLVCSKVAEIIQIGFESSVVFNIVTDKSNDIAPSIIQKIGRGVTILSGEGVYTHQEHKILVCVVRKKQMLSLKKLVLSLDPTAFLYITNAREVNGRGFTLPLSKS